MTRWVELVWTCGECGEAGILGRHKRCPRCGSPREQGEMRFEGLDARTRDGRHAGPSVEDPDLLALAQAGADWFCAYCDSGNRGDAERCAACGAERRERPRKPAPAPPARRVWPWVVAGLLLVAVGTVLLLTHTHEEVATVGSVRWTHVTVLERWTPVRREGWRHELTPRAEVPPRDGGGEVPGVAIVGDSCKRRHYEDERYACGTERVCTPVTRTESYACGEDCVDEGNGFARCTTRWCTREVPDGERCRDETRWCTRPIYRDWCAYDTQDWVEVARATAEGEGTNTRWETLSPGALERLRYGARYEVTVARDGREPHVLDPTEADADALVDLATARAREAAFRRWSPGADVVLDVGVLGGVRAVRLHDGGAKGSSPR